MSIFIGKNTYLSCWTQFIKFIEKNVSKTLKLWAPSSEIRRKCNQTKYFLKRIFSWTRSTKSGQQEFPTHFKERKILQERARTGVWADKKPRGHESQLPLLFTKKVVPNCVISINQTERIEDREGIQAHLCISFREYKLTSSGDAKFSRKWEVERKTWMI